MDSLDGFNSRFERISKCEDRSIDITQSEEQKKKIHEIYEQNVRDLWDSIKHMMQIWWTLQKDRRKQGPQKMLKERMATNFSNLLNDMSVHPRNWTNTKKNKHKEFYSETYYNQIVERQGQRILKQHLSCTRDPQELIANFSAECMVVKRQWNILKMLKEN